MPPLQYSYLCGAIYTIQLKSSLFRPFKAMLRQIGQTGPVYISPQIRTEKHDDSNGFIPDEGIAIGL